MCVAVGSLGPPPVLEILALSPAADAAAAAVVAVAAAAAAAPSFVTTHQQGCRSLTRIRLGPHTATQYAINY